MLTLRNTDFINTVARIVRHYNQSNIPFTRDSVVDAAINSQPHHYYIDPENAIAKIKKLQKQKFFSHPVPRQQKPSYSLWREIYIRSRRYMLTHRNCTLDDAIRLIVETERPSRFFISHTLGLTLSRTIIKSIPRLIITP